MARSSPYRRFPALLALVCAAVGIVLAWPARGRAAGEDGGLETYHERLEYDPATGEWVEKAAPIPGTEEGDLALARALLAHGDFKEAREAFDGWFKTWPESTLRPEALFYAAETEVSAEDAAPRAGDLMQAHRWLEELLDGWPGTELADRAMRKEVIIAEMILYKHHKQKVWKGMLWLSAEEEALMMLDRLIDERAVGSPLAEQALRLKADYHFSAGEFQEAEQAYARLMRDFPRGQYARFALLRAGVSAMARFPGVEFDDADLLEAEVYLKDYRQKYPSDAQSGEVPASLMRINESRAEKDYRVGRYYERIRQSDAAIYYYRIVVRDWAQTTWAVPARQRLIALGVINPEAAPPSDAAVSYDDAYITGDTSNGDTSEQAAAATTDSGN